MRRLAAIAGIFIAAIFAGVLVARAGPEHDTTRDGYVDLRDALDVLSHFGEAPGTPTPQPQIVGNRVFVYRALVASPYSALDLIDTASSQVVRSFGPEGTLHNGPTSCDGRYAAVALRSPPSHSYLTGMVVVDTTSGATLASPATPGGTQPGITLNQVLFPCALRLGGATISGGTPATDRVAISWYDVYPPPPGCPISPCPPVLHHVAVMDLASGQTVYAASQPDSVHMRLNCAGDTLYYLNADFDTVSVRIADGTSTILVDTQLSGIQPC